jgi:hypothetical protein
MSKDKKVRNFLCTTNFKDLQEKDINTEQYLDQVYFKSGAKYVVGQLEKGEKEGTLHIQFYVNFDEPQRMSKLKKVDNRMHIVPVYKNNGADTYCMKEDTRVDGPYQFGEIPIQRNKKTDWEKVWELAKQNKIDEIPANIRVSHYTKLKQIAKDHMIPEDKDHLRGIWIYGPKGAGKSRYVRDRVPKELLYPKLCNKWWDGYTNQKIVVMDDIEPKHNVLSQQLKIWTDRYGCILETKGGATMDKYELFVVTSQYSMEEIWPDDERTLDALKRRFQIYKINELLNLNINLFEKYI